MEQFGAEPPKDEEDGEHPKKRKAPKGKGKGRKGRASKAKKTGKGKGKGKGKGSEKNKVKGKKQDSGPGVESEAKSRRKRKAAPTETATEVSTKGEEDPCTPKKKEPKKKDECSRSKKSKQMPAKPEVGEPVPEKQRKDYKKKEKKIAVAEQVEVAKPQRKKRACTGEATSFARRNPPAKPRSLAEWTAIRAAFRGHLMHMTPYSVHEDHIFVWGYIDKIFLGDSFWIQKCKTTRLRWLFTPWKKLSSPLQIPRTSSGSTARRPRRMPSKALRMMNWDH